MKLFNLEVVTPSRKAFSGEVQSVTIPGTLGSFQVLYNHAPLLSTFEIGKVKVVDSTGKELHFATSGGTVEVRDNIVLMLAETFESPDEIIKERAEKALSRAKDRIAEKNKKDLDLERAELALQRAINRLKVKENRY